jgi:aminoglycoside phosphotransferase (APT) family kinase protein
MTAGVVRVGQTVRRPATAASPFVAALLDHLEAAGFPGSPRHLGWDEQGRDTLTYLDGEVPRWQRFADHQLIALASLVRQMHDATRPLAARLGEDEVVCHHDLGPHNTVLRDGIPAAFFDFDLAAPGDPLEDIAYMAWTWCISSKPTRGPVTGQAQQVALLAEEYGLTTEQRHRLPAAIQARMAVNDDFHRQRMENASSGEAAAAAELLAWTRQEATFIAAHIPVFAAALAG